MMTLVITATTVNYIKNEEKIDGGYLAAEA